MIAVVGEALTDLVIDHDGKVTATPGGAPYNAARACARLGATVAFHGALSTDRFGTMLAAALEADGVSTAAAPRVDLPTTLATAEIGPGNETHYRFYTEHTSAAAGVTIPEPTDEQVLYTGGLALMLEPIASVIDQTVADAVPGRRVFVDVNCRPQAIAHHDRDAYLARVERVLAHADIVKLSDEDLAYLRPGADPRQAAREMLSERTGVLLVTFGAAGATVLTATGEATIAPGPVEVVDTIGAGDGFSAGFVTWWTQAEALARSRAEHHAGVVRAAEAAVAVASAVCARRGADPPWRSELGTPWTAEHPEHPARQEHDHLD